MSVKNEKYRAVLKKPTTTLAANIFDPLSARIAQILGYEVLVLSGSVGKASNLAAPDVVISTLPDVQDHIRRITRNTDIPIMVDAEDGFGNAVNVWRCVRELEAAGVSGIEIEDNVVPRQFGVEHPGLNPTATHVGKLEAAVAARTDPTTVIIARSAAWGEDREHAAERMAAYGKTGADAFMLTGVKSKADVEATHKAAPNIPITILGAPADVAKDAKFCADNNVKILMLGNPTYSIAVKAIYESLDYLKKGGDPQAAEYKAKQADPKLTRQIIRTDEFEAWQKKYMR
jgi:carboxyvinyl-carboxyphosphonate phosphorylmutase